MVIANPASKKRPGTGLTSGRVAIAGAALAIWVFSFLAQWPALSGWWSADDPLILRFAVEHSIDEYLFDAEVWRSLPIGGERFFMPLLPISFRIDYALFGLDPSGFFLHHLTVAGLLGVFAFALLRLYYATSWSLAGAALFVVGSPVAVVAQELQSRHYLEGTLLSLVSIVFFVRAMRTRTYLSLAVSLLAYVVAMCCKEPFFLVAFVILLLPERSLRERLRYASGHLVAFGLFVIVRAVFLDSLIGGSGRSIDLQSALLLGPHFFAYTFGKQVGAVVCALIIAIAWWLTPGRWRVLVVSGFYAILLFGPLVPTSYNLAARHYLGPWAATCVLVVVLSERLWRQRRPHPVWVGVALLFVGIVVGHRTLLERSRFVAARHEYRVQGLFFLEAAESQRILATPSLGSPGFFDSLRALYALEAAEPVTGTTIYFDELDLFADNLDGVTIWRYDARSATMADLTPRLPEMRRHWQSMVREAPLTVRLSYSDGTLHWDLGPEGSGFYTLIAPSSLGRHRLPPRDRHRVRLGRTELYFRYDSPEGWITYSPG